MCTGRNPKSPSSPGATPQRRHGITALRALGALALALIASSCGGGERRPPTATYWESVLPWSDPGPPRAAPRAPGPELTELAVEGFEPAVLSVPRATQGRPLLVAAHGAGDRPEAQCELWRDIVGERAFVLCPRGEAMDPGFYFRSHHELRRELLAGLDAFAGRFPEADPSRAVYAGFSQGAIMGALVLHLEPERFERAVLVEGGQREWNAPIAAKWRAGGGARVLFACGRPPCAAAAEQSASHLDQAGALARVIANDAGHTYAGRMEADLREAFEWVVEGDPRWAR